MSESQDEEWLDNSIDQSYLKDKEDWQLPYVDLFTPTNVHFTKRAKKVRLLHEYAAYSTQHISAEKFRPITTTKELATTISIKPYAPTTAIPNP